MKRTINDPRDYVRQMLAGLVSAHSNLIVADFDSMLCCRRQPLPVGTVACVSGGGSGHEPLHAGFVGEGMLAAAVLGDVYAAPSSDQISTAMSVADVGGGVLLIVKNYTGDVLNFRLAAEDAEDRGIEHATVVVAEDASLPASGDGPGRRGTAGTVFVEKIAGAAAAAGYTLAATAALAQRVADSSRSIAVATSACTPPMADGPTFELSRGEVEFGVGIHGERGRRRQPRKPAREQADELVDVLVSDLGLSAGARLLVFTNGLGGTPVGEQYLFHSDVVTALQRRRMEPVRHLVGSYVTSLDMTGLSVSIVPVDDDLVDLWDAPVRTPAIAW
ncbi:dihydroxyacetone kinase subunit DhaK [Mycobacterium sp. 21AC1]|uniref:dihydroxyacetone kinase subunit DhaK n=1 Tax=[Mycobacterium] appelbergii TaxID=2939269 RepID=UPI002938D302|nr:dihydroxyacetone kinase subunit DhaK [Mycobacterium sp. 21AC1]MDV3129522.1 dihydroxyacetone kinase subunit DhaK [Mycobacterium sp. 21AC1]